MFGNTLFPLQTLKSKSVEKFEYEIKKYDDHPQRKELPYRTIKKLNCPQAEVLHFSPIHPYLMFEGLRSVFPHWDYSQKFYEIPINRIEGIPSVKFDMNCTGEYVFGEDELEEMFELVTPQNYSILSKIPPEAIEFYQQWKDRGQKGAPAMARIPHIMVRGNVDVSDCAIIDWKNPI